MKNQSNNLSREDAVKIAEGLKNPVQQNIDKLLKDLKNKK